MSKFPIDAPQKKVLNRMKELGFEVERTTSHITLRRQNQDGTITPMTLPKHLLIKGSTLQTSLRNAGVSKEQFLSVY